MSIVDSVVIRTLVGGFILSQLLTSFGASFWVVLFCCAGFGASVGKDARKIQGKK